MGILDGILGNLSGSTEGGAALMASAMSIMESHGGLDGVLDKFRQNGMKEQVESWIGAGPNLGITAEQIHKVFDPAAIQVIAEHLGVSTGKAGQSLATLLPELVHRLTPEGKVPENAKALLTEGLAKLESLTA